MSDAAPVEEAPLLSVDAVRLKKPRRLDLRRLSLIIGSVMSTKGSIDTDTCVWLHCEPKRAR